MVPTTDEMDGIFTEEDRLNRYNVYAQCIDCLKWTLLQANRDTIHDITRNSVCAYCQTSNFDSRSVKSKRTFNYLTDNKRRPGKKTR